MFIADLFQAGYMPLQHHGYAKDGLKLNRRAAPFADRVIGREVGDNGLGHYDVDYENLTNADIIGGLFWPQEKDKRFQGAWAFSAFPAIAVADNSRVITGNASQTLGKLLIRPVGDGSFSPDMRFKAIPAAVAPLIDKVLPGTAGMLLQATDEDRQVNLFFPAADNKLVAVNHAGDPSGASLVYDLTKNNQPDKKRRARLHSMMRVVRPSLPLRFGGTFIFPVPGRVKNGGFDPAELGNVIEKLIGVIDGKDPRVPNLLSPDQLNPFGTSLLGRGNNVGSGTIGLGVGAGRGGGIYQKLAGIFGIGKRIGGGAGIQEELVGPFGIGLGRDDLAGFTEPDGGLGLGQGNKSKKSREEEEEEKGPERLNSLAWQLSPAGRDLLPGYGFVSDVGEIKFNIGNQATTTEDDTRDTLILGTASFNFGGPFDVGFNADKHRLGMSRDKEPINPIHLTTNSIFKAPFRLGITLGALGGLGFLEPVIEVPNEQGFWDAPLHFEKTFYQDSICRPYRQRVHLRYDRDAHHLYFGEHVPGLWRWESETIWHIVCDPREDVITGEGTGGKEDAENIITGSGINTVPNVLVGIIQSTTNVEPETEHNKPELLNPQNVSDRIGKKYAWTHIDVAFTQFLARPQDSTLGSEFIGNITCPPADLIEDLDQTIPITGIMTAFGGFVGAGQPVYTQRPGNSTFQGGTGPGGFMLTSPELSIADVATAFNPTDRTRSTSRMVYTPGTRLSFGTPDTATGGLTAGGGEIFIDDNGDISFTGQPEFTEGVQAAWSGTVPAITLTGPNNASGIGINFPGTGGKMVSGDVTANNPNTSYPIWDGSGGGIGFVDGGMSNSDTLPQTDDILMSIDTSGSTTGLALDPTAPNKTGDVFDDPVVWVNGVFGAPSGIFSHGLLVEDDGGYIYTGFVVNSRSQFTKDVLLYYANLDVYGTIHATGDVDFDSDLDVIGDIGADDITSSGFVDVGTTLTVAETSFLAGQLTFQSSTPAQITSNQNNYIIGDEVVIRLDTDANRNITGILPNVAGATENRYIIIVNVGSFRITLTNEDAASTAANRIITPTGTSFKIPSGSNAMLIYDNTSDRWRVLNG